jgi:hypothetical protein
MATAALLAVCSRMNMIGIVTDVRHDCIIVHLMITPESTISTHQGYKKLEASFRDGTLERDLDLGPLRFEVEDCIDDSLLMLLHQQRCNFEAILRHSGASVQALMSKFAEFPSPSEIVVEDLLFPTPGTHMLSKSAKLSESAPSETPVSFGVPKNPK